MPNHLTTLDRIVLIDIVGAFSGTFLAFTTRGILLMNEELEVAQESSRYQILQDGLLMSIAIAAVFGCISFGAYSFNLQSIDIPTPSHTFIVTFGICLISVSSDVLIKLIKLAFFVIAKNHN